MRSSCEHCDKALGNESEEAMICTFECTFCQDCVHTILHNVCPNCGGGFEKRPTRPVAYLKKYPVSTKKVYKPVQEHLFKVLLKKFKNTNPRKR